jgi:ATP-binding protein involved in chromosome partitioning
MWARVSVPVLGVVENMAWFMAPGSTERMQLFPKGSLDKYLGEAGIAKLGEVPFHPNVGLGSEAGIPVIESDPTSDEGKAFTSIAQSIDNLLLG